MALTVTLTTLILVRLSGMAEYACGFQKKIHTVHVVFELADPILYGLVSSTLHAW